MERDGGVHGLEAVWKLCDGSTIDVRESARAVRDASGKVLHYDGTVEDITERKRAEELIKTLLQEKELVLKEVHHRIKNNMSTMMGLLSLQAHSVKNAEAAAALIEARNRLQSMQVLYDKLFRSQFFENVSIKEYLTSLSEEIIHNFPNRINVTLRTEIEDFQLNADATSSLGILINELLTNSMKYAFVGRTEGIVTVCVSIKDKHVLISVQDDGVGVPESVGIGSSSGFGLQLVDMLAKQLSGTIRLEKRNGTKVVLEFEV
jgi:two-component sensor histidine kinase